MDTAHHVKMNAGAVTIDSRPASARKIVAAPSAAAGIRRGSVPAVPSEDQFTEGKPLRFLPWGLCTQAPMGDTRCIPIAPHCPLGYIVTTRQQTHDVGLGAPQLPNDSIRQRTRRGHAQPISA